MAIASNQVNELLYQALETEMGGVKVYETAVRCAVNEDLKKEWTEYLEQTREHERILREVFDAAGPRSGSRVAGTCRSSGTSANRW